MTDVKHEHLSAALVEKTAEALIKDDTLALVAVCDHCRSEISLALKCKNAPWEVSRLEDMTANYLDAKAKMIEHGLLFDLSDEKQIAEHLEEAQGLPLVSQDIMTVAAAEFDVRNTEALLTGNESPDYMHDVAVVRDTLARVFFLAPIRDKAVIGDEAFLAGQGLIWPQAAYLK